jgi:hypothetical protein
VDLAGCNLRDFGVCGRFQGCLCVSIAISFDGRDEAIALLGNGFDVKGLVGGIAEASRSS